MTDPSSSAPPPGILIRAAAFPVLLLIVLQLPWMIHAAFPEGRGLTAALFPWATLGFGVLAGLVCFGGKADLAPRTGLVLALALAALRGIDWARAGGGPPAARLFVSAPVVLNLLAAAWFALFQRAGRSLEKRAGPVLAGVAFLSSMAAVEFLCRVVSGGEWSEASHWRWYASAVRRNELGLRGPSVDWKRERFSRRVLVLGDSFAFGYKVAQEESLGPVLQALLKDRGIEVVVAAEPNWTIHQQKAFWDARGEALAPETVVVAHVLNDIAAATDHPMPLWRLWLYYNSYAARWLRPFWDAREAPRAIEAMAAAYRPGSPGWEDYFNGLAALDASVRARGGRLVLMLFPWFTHFERYPFHGAHRDFGRTLAEKRVPFLDLLPVYAPRPARTWTVSWSDLHPNAAAHRAAAEALASFLTE